MCRLFKKEPCIKNTSSMRALHVAQVNGLSCMLLLFQDVDPDSIQCHLTAENNLVINGKVDGSENVKEREVKIERKEQGNASSDDK